MELAEELELYDPLKTKGSLILYMIQKGQDWVEIASEELAIGQQYTRILEASQDYRPLLKRRVKVGERLTYHVKKEGSPWETYIVTPSDWVVVNVFRYEADLSEVESELPEFRDLQIAYCQRKPLSEEEVAAKSYEVVSQVSVDSFGGDEEAYRKFLDRPESHSYVRG